MVLVFTDGVDNASFLGPSEILPAARRMGVVVHAVELRSGAQPPFTGAVVSRRPRRRDRRPAMERDVIP